MVNKVASRAYKRRMAGWHPALGMLVLLLVYSCDNTGRDAWYASLTSVVRMRLLLAGSQGESTLRLARFAWDDHACECPVVVASGGQWVMLDGEVLPMEGNRIEWGDIILPDALHVQLHADFRKALWQDLGYVFVGPEARRYYACMLLDHACDVNDDAVDEVVHAEHNRLIRAVKDPWRSWQQIGRMAAALRAVVEERTTTRGRQQLIESLDLLIASARIVAQWRLDDEHATLVDRIVRSCTDSTDGKFVRRRIGPEVGLYDAARALDEVRSAQLGVLEKYWDSRALTRYVEESSGLWRVITVGEWVQEYVRRRAGRRMTSGEFVKWVGAK